MLYPRVTKDGQLVSRNQMVPPEEHLFRQHRLLLATGIITSSTFGADMLLALDSMNRRPIKLVITSIGGDLDTALLFYDTIHLIKSPVYTIGRFCASAAALLLAAGKRRYLFPNAKVMIHLPWGQASGDAHDWEIQHKEMQKYKDKIADILLECGVKRSKQQLLADMDREYWLNPQEAIDYGLADEVLTPKRWRQLL